jgi:hypothetical protein
MQFATDLNTMDVETLNTYFKALQRDHRACATDQEQIPYIDEMIRVTNELRQRGAL